MNEISEFIEVDRLTSAMLDGTISQDDFARLDEMLFKDADKRARYLEIVRMESLLHWEAVDSGSNITLSHENAKIISFPAPSIISSIAAILLAMAGSWWAFHHLSVNATFSPEVANISSSSSSAYPSLDPIPSELNALFHRLHRYRFVNRSRWICIPQKNQKSLSLGL